MPRRLIHLPVLGLAAAAVVAACVGHSCFIDGFGWAVDVGVAS